MTKSNAKSDKGYMFVRYYVPVDWNESIILVGDGPSMMNEKAFASTIVNLPSWLKAKCLREMPIYWDKFKRLEYNLPAKVE